MRTATKTAVVAVSAVAAALAVAVAAYAGAALQGTLSVTPAGGHYGDEVTISPSMNTTALPGDAVDIQYLDQNNEWQKYGESLAVEETVAPDPVTGRAVIGPLSFIVDDSLTYPAVLRAVFTPKDSSEGTCSSQPVWLRLYKNVATKVVLSGVTTATAGVTYPIASTVKPVSGIGSIRVTVRRLARRAGTAVYTITTDDAGTAIFNFKRTLKGRYVVTERWLGNRFGVPSAVASKYIAVK